jgi:hypothetical protein
MHRNKTASLFDHFVGPAEQWQRDRDPHGFCSLEVDHHLRPTRLLDGNVRGLLTQENARDIATRKPSDLFLIDPIADKPSLPNSSILDVNDGQAVTQGQRSQELGRDADQKKTALKRLFALWAKR